MEDVDVQLAHLTRFV